MLYPEKRDLNPRTRPWPAYRILGPRPLQRSEVNPSRQDTKHCFLPSLGLSWRTLEHELMLTNFGESEGVVS